MAILDMEKEVIEACFRWLGYGKLNSPLWFLGIEESGTEIIYPDPRTSKTKGKLSIEDSLKRRSKFSKTENLYQVWEGYGFEAEELIQGPSTWRYITAFILALNGDKINPENINKFIKKDKLLGLVNNESFDNAKYNHFLGEFYPLPNPKLSKLRKEYYVLGVNDRVEYNKSMNKMRSKLFLDEIELASELKLIICYKTNLLEIFANNSHIKSYRYPIGAKNNAQEFNLYDLNLDTKKVKLLITPFFGNGRISYRGVENVVEDLLKDGYLT